MAAGPGRHGAGHAPADRAAAAGPLSDPPDPPDRGPAGGESPCPRRTSNGVAGATPGTPCPARVHRPRQLPALPRHRGGLVHPAHPRRAAGRPSLACWADRPVRTATPIRTATRPISVTGALPTASRRRFDKTLTTSGPWTAVPGECAA